MRVIFTVFTAIILVAAAIFFFGPLLISTDEVRAQLLSQVQNATGYRLRVGGPVKFSLFPSLNLVAEDVGVSQGTPGSEIITAKKLRFGLLWSALWGGQVQLTEVTLVDPVIAIPARSTLAQPKEDEAGRAGQAFSNGRSAAAALQNLTLDKLVIENGTVILPSAANAPGKRIEQFNLEASLPFNAPLTFDMKGAYEGKPVAIAGSIGDFGTFMSGMPAPVSLSIEAPEHLATKATLTAAATYKDDGLTLNELTAKSGDITLTGNASYKDNILTLHPLTATTYGTTFSGSMAVNLSSKVPAVNAALTADTLDLNKLLAGSGERRADMGGEDRMLADVGSIAGTSSSKGASSGSPSRSTWNEAKINYAALRTINAKLKLTAQQLIYANIRMNPGTLEATLTSGKLNAVLPNLKLYNGTGAASLSLDASSRMPAQRLKLSLAQFDAYPFLRDATGFQNIEGTGAITIDLAASGTSQAAMVSTLAGNTRLDFTNGAIRGINVAKMVRNLTQATLSGWQDAATEKTDFASLGASFQVANGQAQTKDLQLVGPLVRMNGEGTVNLPARTLNLRVNPQIVASLEGQGGKTDLQGLGVPIVISGPWASPRIYPDIKGILENPVAAYEQLNKLNQFGGGLVKLPSLDELGEKAGVSNVPLSNIVKDGKIDRNALQQGAVEGLGQLLNKQGKQKGVAPQAVAPATTHPAVPAEIAPNDPAATTPLAQPEPSPQPAETVTEEPPVAKAQTKAEQKKQRKQEQRREAEDAAKQLLENLFGN